MAHEVMEEQYPKAPSLIASTRNTYCCTIAESKTREDKLLKSQFDGVEGAKKVREEDVEHNYFKSAQWSADGTSLITSSADNTIRTFILPHDLLDTHPSPLILAPFTTHQNPSPINCIAPYPHYTLSDPSTTLYLSTPSNLPIRLCNSLSPFPTPISTYNWISPATEKYYTPSSLLWTSPSTFLAGTDCLIALFNVSQNGSGPAQSMPTIPSKRHKMKGGGVGMRGIVSALSLQPSSGGETSETSMVAAGTWTRWIGLYDMAGVGGTVATWSIAEAADKDAGIGGSGITQTAWSSCGRYLYVVERKSNGVLVFDVRGAGKLLAWLEDREAGTNQRLCVDVFAADGGMEIWAGGVDGVVRVWESVGKTEGALTRSWEWRAHDDPVTSTIVHSSGTVVATCSGQRALPDDKLGGSCYEPSVSDDSSDSDSYDDSEDDSDNESGISSQSSDSPSRIPDNSIKVWSL